MSIVYKGNRTDNENTPVYNSKYTQRVNIPEMAMHTAIVQVGCVSCLMIKPDQDENMQYIDHRRNMLIDLTQGVWWWDGCI